MGQWRYSADGGEYTVDESRLREIVADGALAGDARVVRLDDDSLHRVDITFSKEYRTALAEKARQRSEAEVTAKSTKTPFFGRNLLAFLVLAGAAYAAYSWWSSRVTCSQEQVQTLVSSIIKDKLLKSTQGTVTLHNISTIGTTDNGGAKCTADADVADTGVLDGLRAVEYSAETRGNSLYATARLTR